MKIAVTGASGFIGRSLCERLARLPFDHVPLDLRTGVPRLDGIDAVVHLAAIAHVRDASADELARVNVELPRQVGRAAAAAGARMLYVSSVKVHGEETERPLVESSPIAPRDPYAASKAKAEEALRGIAGLRLCVVRPPLVYGPGVKANFLALLRSVARGWPLPLGAIANRRSLVYVGNLADALIRCLDVEGTFLVSDGAPVSTQQLCREIGEALGKPARLFPFPPAMLPRKLTGSLEVDDSAIRALGWRAPHTRKEGLKATADWYLGR
jgi:nucleoside-diphosphate-sugar epimerase